VPQTTRLPLVRAPRTEARGRSQAAATRRLLAHGAGDQRA
jgi:hypothetical protein